MRSDSSSQSVQACEATLGDQLRLSPGVLLALIGGDVARRLRAAHTDEGLTPRQFHVLGVLNDGGALGQTELGRRMDLDASMLVALLNPLEATGLIARSHAVNDRRRHVVSLTPAGARQLQRALREQQEAEDELFAGFDPDRRAELAVLLADLQESMQRSSQ